MALRPLTHLQGPPVAAQADLDLLTEEGGRAPGGALPSGGLLRPSAPSTLMRIA